MAILKLSLTKAIVEGLEAQEKRYRVHDSKTPKLILLIMPSGHRSWYRYGRIGTSVAYVKLGVWPEVSVSAARKSCERMNSRIAAGDDPREAKRPGKGMTLDALFDEYLERHAKPHKKTWAADQRKFELHCSSLKKRPILEINQKDAQTLHASIGKKSPYSANRLRSLLVKVFNFAIEADDIDCQVNPFSRTKKFKEKSRERFMDGSELAKLFVALDDEPNETFADYVRLSLFTGARQAKVLAMQWEEIDFARQEWRIPETKNGESVTVPLPPQALEILEQRRSGARSNASYVLPGTGVDGHLTKPRKTWLRLLKRAGIKKLRMHDLRRTMGSWQAMTGASLQVIGKSLGHRDYKSTLTYARLNMDPVRQAVDTATAAMMNAARQEGRSHED